MYLWAKDTITAVEHYRKAYNLDPENLDRISDLAWLLVRSGINTEEGLELSQKGLKKYPDNSFLLWIKGLALHKSGRHEEALEILKEADERWIGYNKDLKKDINEVERSCCQSKEDRTLSKQLFGFNILCLIYFSKVIGNVIFRKKLSDTKGFPGSWYLSWE